MATVRIPSPLRRLTDKQSKVEVGGATIQELIDNLDTQYPGVKARLCDDTGQVKRYVNIFINGNEIHTLQGGQTAVADGDEISIVPAMAGGR
jgi:molybdopterin synthase sulfur carrier subunit